MKRYFFCITAFSNSYSFLFQSENISRHTSLKALQSMFLACLSESLEEIVFNVSTGKLKSMIGQSGLSLSINLCKECPSRCYEVGNWEKIGRYNRKLRY